MPVITFFQTKGGTGKTTSAFLLAEILSKSTSVSVIDADPNKPFDEWQKECPKELVPFKIVTEIDDEQIGEVIRTAQSESAFVIVDTEGTANATAAAAAAISDLVIITSEGTPLDQKAAGKAIGFVKAVGKRAGREIPLRVLLTKQQAIARSRTVKQAEKDMEQHGIEVFQSMLIRRDAFAAIFGYNTTLFALDAKKVNDPFKGYTNAKVYAMEVAQLVDELVNGLKDKTKLKSASADKKSADKKQPEKSMEAA